MTVTNVLFKKFPSAGEGTMTKYRSRIVSRKKLRSIALKMKLNKLVIAKVQRPLEETSIIGNALEALLGAIYITKGYRFTEKFIENKIISPYIDLNKPEKLDEDYKSRLIEQCQAEQKRLDFITEQQKEEIQPSFRCTVRIDNEELASGTGKSKKKQSKKRHVKFWNITPEIGQHNSR
jgi:ribonuclease-3